jgi:hypothetical protein
MKTPRPSVAVGHFAGHFAHNKHYKFYADFPGDEIPENGGWGKRPFWLACRPQYDSLKPLVLVWPRPLSPALACPAARLPAAGGRAARLAPQRTPAAGRRVSEDWLAITGGWLQHIWLIVVFLRRFASDPLKTKCNHKLMHLIHAGRPYASVCPIACRLRSPIRRFASGRVNIPVRWKWRRRFSIP